MSPVFLMCVWDIHLYLGADFKQDNAVKGYDRARWTRVQSMVFFLFDQDLDPSSGTK